MQRELVLLVLLLCSCSPGSPRPTATPPPSIEAEEYAVYSALIRQNPIGYNLGSFIVIREQTVSDADMFERTLKEVRGLPAKLVDSYRSRNAASYTLGLNLDVEQDYALMPQEENDRIFGAGGATWARFQARYPKSYLLPTCQACSLTRYQVAAISCKRCQPRQITVMPGSPSPLRPRKPPSLAIQRTACRTVGGDSRNAVVL